MASSSSSAFGPPSSIPRLPLIESSFDPSSSSSSSSRPLVSTSLADVKPHFEKTLRVAALCVPAKDVGKVRTHPDSTIQDALLRAPRISPIANGPAPGTKLFLLAASEIPPHIRSWAEAQGYAIVDHELHLDYDYYTADEILAALLPLAGDNGTPTGYTTIGHIAHVNLRPEYLPYRHLIGQVLLDKNSPQIRTVVNKLDSIDAEFRFFAMELLAGDDDYVVESNESNCIFRFDFRNVYFNSRLHTEHARIWGQLAEGSVVADVMAGVGPFALPAAKNRRCRVYANDLNPHCYEALVENAQRNRVAEGVKSTCEDGREFIRGVVLRAWNREIGDEWQGARSKTQEEKARRSGVKAESVKMSPPSRLVEHFLMNLPATAIEFLDAYRGLYTRLAESVGKEAVEAEARGVAPVVHVHTFTKDLEKPERDIVARANTALGLGEDHPQRLVSESAKLHWVRKVAPNKDMYCLEFTLPQAVLWAT